MRTLRRRLAPWWAAGILVAATAGGNLWIRLDAASIEDSAATVAAEADATSNRVEDLSWTRDELSDQRTAAEEALADREDALAVAEQARDAAAGELATLRAHEDEAGEQLDRRDDEVRSVDQRVDANDALIADLERCLDDATMAANSLSVGDIRTAFDALERAAPPCSRVGIAVR